jgi:signal transduction histidine kinase
MPLPIDIRFLSLVVHDLRTPLNAITLTLRLVDQEVPKGNAELDSDLRMLRDNIAQIERMLEHLSERCRLVDDHRTLRTEFFDPRRMLAELLEDESLGWGDQCTRQLSVLPGCPEAVELDPAWARVAARHALENALAAAEGGPVRVTAGGDPDRLVISVHVDRAPPASVHATSLRSDLVERLSPTPQERRALDLALAARVTELFGGDARLDLELGERSTIVLEWPTRLRTAQAPDPVTSTTA